MFGDPAGWLALVGVVITAIIGFVGVRYTARSSRAAQDLAMQRAAELERTKVDSQAYQRARENYDSAIDTLQTQVEQLKEGREYDREEHKRHMDQLRTRLHELETARELDRMTIATLAAYARVLLALLRDHKIEYPAPPPDLSKH